MFDVCSFFSVFGPIFRCSAKQTEVNDDRIDKLIRRVQGESDKELRTKARNVGCQ